MMQAVWCKQVWVELNIKAAPVDQGQEGVLYVDWNIGDWWF